LRSAAKREVLSMQTGSLACHIDSSAHFAATDHALREV
jgi:hypothetical protein